MIALAVELLASLAEIVVVGLTLLTAAIVGLIGAVVVTLVFLFVLAREICRAFGRRVLPRTPGRTPGSPPAGCCPPGASVPSIGRRR